MKSSSTPHAFLSVSKQGVAGIVETTGNRDCHVVLHGGTSGPNYSEASVDSVCSSLTALNLPARVMVDCGSSNAPKGVPGGQAQVAKDVASRVARGDSHVFGVMLPSFLVSGRQELVPGKAPTYGMSISEPCMDWSSTAEVLEELAEAVRQRRALLRPGADHPQTPDGISEPGATFQELGDLEATDNLRVKMIRPLLPPACVMEVGRACAMGG